MSSERENEIERLYSLQLDQFTAARNALARMTKSAGEPAIAAEIAALKKPNLVAWTVNQLAATKRREVDLLLDAGKRIVDAQQESISQGGRAELDQAQATLRKAVRELTESAAEILGSRASPTTLVRVAETLRSAATGTAGRELLARGRLTHELNDTGWETVATLTPAAPKTKASSNKDNVHRVGQRKAARSAAQRQKHFDKLRDLEKARTAASQNLRRASEHETAATHQLERAQAATNAAKNALASIESAIHAAELELDAPQ